MYQCDQPNCDKMCKTPGLLGIHKHYAHGIRGVKAMKRLTVAAFKCPECPRSFSKANYLARHAIVHKKEPAAILVKKNERGTTQVNEIHEYIPILYGRIERDIENLSLASQIPPTELASQLFEFLRVKARR